MNSLADSLVAEFPPLPEEESSPVENARDEKGNLYFNKDDVRPLFCAVAPRRELVREKAWHRTAAYLYAKGNSVREICQALDKTHSSVSLLLQQPFFRELVATITREYALEDEGALGILRNAGVSAAEVITRLAENSKSDAVRLSAAKEILNRLYGNTTQVVVHNEGRVPVDPAKEKAKLEEEIARLSSRVPVMVNVQTNISK